MYQVILARLGRCLRPEHLEGELADLAGQFRLVELFERAGDDAAHEHTGCEFGQRRCVTAHGARENFYLGAELGEPPGYLHDVDVQAASVTGAWLVER